MFFIWGLGSLAVLHTYMEVCVVILHVAKALQVKIIELFAQAWYAELSLQQLDDNFCQFVFLIV